MPKKSASTLNGGNAAYPRIVQQGLGQLFGVANPVPPPPKGKSSPGFPKSLWNFITRSKKRGSTSTQTSQAFSWNDFREFFASASEVKHQPAPPLTAVPPQPPNWKRYYDETIMSFKTHKTFPVEASSNEYKTIAGLMSPLLVNSVDLIVNPDLWKQYCHRRKEMLLQKSDDLSLLSQLGLDEAEIHRCAHLSLNFDKHPLLTSESENYSPNEALLFHCTKNEETLKSILSQGLDERLSQASGGLLGRGIYFADDPMKSILYDGTEGTILVFAVLLGDCLPVDHLPSKSLLCREPMKGKRQKRNFNDRHFDSITARLGAVEEFNEYVTYNRFQCVPLYLVRYDLGAAQLDLDSICLYAAARQESPAIAWGKEIVEAAQPSMPNQTLNGNWPFYAASLFNKMKDEREEANNETDKPDVNPTCSTVDDADESHEMNEAGETSQLDDNEKVTIGVDDNLGQVETMDEEPQPSTSGLHLFTASTKPKLENVVDGEWESSSDSEDETMKPNSVKLPSTSGMSDKQAECLICFVSPASPDNWKQLKCLHKLCLSCYEQIETEGKTMAGIKHTSVRCPFCQEITGILVGNCPDGDMRVTVLSKHCKGYKYFNTIRIRYLVHSGAYRRYSVAYLPATPEGKEVLNLLATAWDRRLCFTIGNSITSGQQNVLVWNIHHKTAMKGGVAAYGYPDTGYFARVKGELKGFGIEKPGFVYDF